MDTCLRPKQICSQKRPLKSNYSPIIHERKLRINLPRDVGFHRNPIHRERAPFPSRRPLQLLDLAPNLMRDPFYKRIRLRSQPINTKPNQKKKKKPKLDIENGVESHLDEIITESEQRIKRSDSQIGRIELQERDRKRHEEEEDTKP